MVWEARHHGTPQFLEGFPYSKGLISGWFDKRFLRICQELMAQNKLETYLDVFSTCVFFALVFPKDVSLDSKAKQTYLYEALSNQAQELHHFRIIYGYFIKVMCFAT